jgi:hypothetical protein
VSAEEEIDPSSLAAFTRIAEQEWPALTKEPDISLFQPYLCAICGMPARWDALAAMPVHDNNTLWNEGNPYHVPMRLQRA